LRIAIAIAAIECVAVATYAVSILVVSRSTASQGTSGSDVSPWVLVAIYVIFAGLIAINIRGLIRGNGSARTPYLVIQAFAVVVAQALVSGSETFEIAAGWTLISLAVAGAISILRPSASTGLNIHR
jgi:hypothetical protein